MTTAYENALTILGVTNRDNPVTEILAKKIVDLAGQGERNPVELCGRALGEVEGH